MLNSIKKITGRIILVAVVSFILMVVSSVSILILNLTYYSGYSSSIATVTGACENSVSVPIEIKINKGFIQTELPVKKSICNNYTDGQKINVFYKKENIPSTVTTNINTGIKIILNVVLSILLVLSLSVFVITVILIIYAIKKKTEVVKVFNGFINNLSDLFSD